MINIFIRLCNIFMTLFMECYRILLIGGLGIFLVALFLGYGVFPIVYTMLLGLITSFIFSICQHYNPYNISVLEYINQFILIPTTISLIVVFISLNENFNYFLYGVTATYFLCTFNYICPIEPTKILKKKKKNK